MVVSLLEGLTKFKNAVLSEFRYDSNLTELDLTVLCSNKTMVHHF